MQQLTGLDAAFLAMETPSVYGHVGSVCVLDPSTAPEPLTLERLTQVIESRLHLIPPFRRRLVTVPFGLDQPYWIEDPDFDLEFHVRELALPAPGDDRQLAEQAARLHARQLGRRRNLLLSSTGLRAPATPFNRSIGPHRRWAFRSVPFESVRAVKNAAGVTVNDVVMAMCAGALRRWLTGRDALPASPLIAG